MTFESWDDAMFWQGSLIGYMAGVRSACEDADKPNLLLKVIDMQAKLESIASENAKLRTFIRLKETCWKYVGWCDKCPYNGVDDEHDDCNCTVQEMVNSLAHELGIEVIDG